MGGDGSLPMERAAPCDLGSACDVSTARAELGAANGIGTVAVTDRADAEGAAALYPIRLACAAKY
jgi:hypothetical protein